MSGAKVEPDLSDKDDGWGCLKKRGQQHTRHVVNEGLTL